MIDLFLDRVPFVPAHAAVLGPLELADPVRALHVEFFDDLLFRVLGDQSRKRRVPQRIKDARGVAHAHRFQAGLEHLFQHVIDGDIRGRRG